MKYLVTIGLILLVIFIIFLIISFVVSVFFYSIVGIVMLLWKYTFPTVTVVLIIISVIKRDLTFFLYGEFILVTLEMILIVFEQLRRQIIKQWQKGYNGGNINLDKVFIAAIDSAYGESIPGYTCKDMPYGRADAFINYFNNLNMKDEYYLFIPKPTEDICKMRENGLLIAKSGCYIASEKSGKDCFEHFKFKDVYNYNKKTQQVMLIDSANNLIKKDLKEMISSVYCDKISIILDKLCKNNIPQYLSTYGLQNNSDYKNDINKEVYDNNTVARKAGVNAILAASAKNRNIRLNENKSYMNGRQGHGYAAEYANLTVDRILNRNVINEAQNLDPNTGKQVTNGADRIVDGTYIQSKYVADFPSLWRGAFSSGEGRYMHDGEWMKIEVPRDKYVNYKNELQKKIDSGDLNGIEPGTDAGIFLKKGYISYQESVSIAKAGTVEGVVIDAANGVMCALPAATISAVIIFAQSIWNGNSADKAARASFEVFIEGVGKVVAVHVVTSQLIRKNVRIPITGESMENPLFNLANNLTGELKNTSFAKTNIGQTLGMDKLTGQKLLSGTVTAIVYFGPDVYKYFQGRISEKQLFKNVTSTAAGIAVGAKMGAAMRIVGMIAGGILGSMATKKVLDTFIIDDAQEMFVIFKEEFIDVITMSRLTREEFIQIADWTVNNDDFSNFLELMYSKEEPRLFAREYLNELVQYTYSLRQPITIEMIEEGYQLLCENNG